jgi:hypothetical protein
MRPLMPALAAPILGAPYARGSARLAIVLGLVG